jgi:high-affinity nickel-transport protein
MPATLPTEALGLAALVFLLGVRHGFDPDHLVAIDGLVRSSIERRPRWARWCGLFFSLGHGVVVTLVGVAVALAATRGGTASQVPPWLAPVGAAISIGVLAVLGAANSVAALRAPAGEGVALVGLRGRWWSERLSRASHPAVIAAIGAAFALSFDTISHALVFSLTGASLAGWAFAAALGIVFTAGMALTDALNGWWVARLVGRADRRAAIASRCMSAAIGALCLLLAAGSLAQAITLLPEAPHAAPLFSLATLAVIVVAYALGNRLAPHGARAQ